MEIIDQPRGLYHAQLLALLAIIPFSIWPCTLFALMLYHPRAIARTFKTIEFITTDGEIQPLQHILTAWEIYPITIIFTRRGHLHILLEI